MNLKKLIKNFLEDEQGSELVEYALVLSILTIGSIVSVQLIGTAAFSAQQNSSNLLQNSSIVTP